MTKRTSKKHAEWRTRAGRTITEAEAAKLADQFESEDFDLQGARITYPKKAGRPSLTGKAKISPQVSFRVSEDTRAQAQRVADERGTSVSALAREALEELLRHTS